MLSDTEGKIFSKRVVTVLAVICLVLLIASFWFTFYTWDDYKFLAGYKQYGLWGTIKYLSIHDDSRFSTIPYMIHLLLFLKLITNIKAFLLLHLLILFVNSFLVIKIIELTRPGVTLFQNRLTSTIFLVVFYWLGSYFYSTITDTLYWGTGSDYNFFNLTALIWIYLLLKQKSGTRSTAASVVFLISSVIAGNTSPHVILGLVFLGITELLSADNSRLKRSILLSITGLAIGFSYAFIFKGTSVRMNPYSSSSSGIAGLIRGYAQVLYTYSHFYFLFALFFVTIIGGAIVLQKEKLFKAPSNSGIVHILQKYKYLLAVLVTIAPFALVPQLASGRTSCFGAYLLIIQFFVLSGSYLSQRTSQMTFGLFFLLFMVAISKNMYNQRPLYNEIKARELILAQNQGKDVILKSVKSRCPQTYKFLELNADPNYPKNVEASIFYNVHSIAIDTTSK